MSLRPQPFDMQTQLQWANSFQRHLFY